MVMINVFKKKYLSGKDGMYVFWKYVYNKYN